MSHSHKSDEAILAATRHLSEEERTVFLEATCGDDPETRHRVESMLAQIPTTKASTIFETPVPSEIPTSTGPSGTILVDSDATVSDTVMLAAEEAIGDVIGRYKLQEKIGEGGFGLVYIAEQTEPVRRQVALKIIKLGMDTRQVVARFEAERQALAVMDHPNIAKVLDGGATDTGRPYFVMELVHGTKITEHCDRNKLSIPQRLDLFMMVCRAIEHAHQKGIIHRDIKPSNILITIQDGEPVPKVIDFGIAKATQGTLTDRTVFTQMDQFIGTPAYMSPEQAELNGGLDIDTRSDIYSLGVLLYELLTGETPLESKNLLSRGFDEMRRLIREWEPQKPSVRLHKQGSENQTTTATRHGTDAPKLIRMVQGDLDWVVMKCLEKDRKRRYDSAAQLTTDIHRFLTNEPVMARPPSTLYRVGKMVRRNRLAFAAGGFILLLLIVGLVGTSWLVVKEKKERDNAEQASINSDNARRIAVAEQQKAEAAQKEAEIARHQADAARAQVEGALQQARDDRTKALAEEKKAEAAEKEAEAALRQAREDRNKAGIAEKQAQSSQSEAKSALELAKAAETRAQAETAKSEEAAKAAAAQAALRAQAEASLQQAGIARQQALAEAAAAQADVSQVRQTVSNFIAHLDSLPPGDALKASAAFYTSADEKQPWAPQFLHHRGEWHARRGYWNNAIADFSKALELNPHNFKSYHSLALLLGLVGETNELVQNDTLYLADFGGANDPATLRTIALDCLLVPLPDVDLGTAASLAKRALDAGPADASSCENQLAFGLANYRQAHYAEATNWLAKSIAGSAQNMVCAAQAQAALALALQQLQQTNDARVALEKSTAIIDTKLPKLESGDLGPDWRGWIVAHCLSLQGASLLETPLPAKPAN